MSDAQHYEFLLAQSFILHLSSLIRTVRLALVFAIALPAMNVRAADNVLSPAEKAEGWILLFNGKNAAGWKNNNKKPVTAKVEHGALNPHGAGGYVLAYDTEFGDFVLKCDVKMDQPFCNSGIFVRIGDLSEPVQTGLEVQISTERKPDLHGFASLYDLVPPRKDATLGPGKWDSVEISCQGPRIDVSVNGERVTSINCDEWRIRGKRPDGTSNKFKTAIKDFPRRGYIGLQDHGYNAWYKNIKVRELK